MQALIPVIEVVQILLQLYYWAIILTVILSWLVQFGVVNTRNQFVYSVMNMLARVTEPVLRPIRRLLPNMGGLDISPIIVILILYLVQRELDVLKFSLL